MKVLITGGPTNEPIDKVMKITNMSSGSTAKSLAQMFAKQGYEVTLIITNGIDTSKLERMKNPVNIIRMETTEDLIHAIETLPDKNSYNIIVHSAAVADYKPEFTYRAEDMAKEILDRMYDDVGNYLDEARNEEMISSIVRTLTDPNCKVSDSSKISSYEPNLCVKMGLTSKVIGTLRKQFPDAFICGFKLLENVPEAELIDVATKLLKKNNVDLIFANDLVKLNAGDETRLVIDANGFTGKKAKGAKGIIKHIFLAILLGAAAENLK